jgi:hypothetical protein
MMPENIIHGHQQDVKYGAMS